MRLRKRAWRLLREGKADGAANMARDEALLASAERGATATLRLYAWSRPTLSLGAHQPSAHADFGACRRLGVDLVRRPTGGGAVLHDAEVTYAVAARLGEDPFPASVVGVYERIAGALVAGLSLLGVSAEADRTQGVRPAPDCFARASSREILVGGRKLVGSAQVRRRGAFLQHGSILMAFDASRLAQVLHVPLPGSIGWSAGAPGGPRAEPRSMAEEARSDPADDPPESGRVAAAPAVQGLEGPMTLFECLGSELGRDAVEEAVARGFGASLGIDLESGPLDALEEEEAARLRAIKYLDALWTLEGKLRERR